MKNINIVIRLVVAICLVTVRPVSANVATEQVKKVVIDDNIVLSSTVESVNQTVLSAQTSGQIKQIFVDAGDVVAANTVLIELASAEQSANYNAAKATLRAREADFNDANTTLIRVKNLVEKKLASTQALDDAKARFNITKATKEAAQAQVIQAKQQVNYTKITAPYAGIVLERHVNLGEIVNPGTPLFTGTSLTNLKVVSHIPQTDIAAIKHYEKATVFLPNQQRYQPKSTNLHIYAYANTQSGTVKTRIDLVDQQAKLYPGLKLKTQFKIGERETLVIPPSALVKRAELRAVYVKTAKGAIQFRQVKVGSQLNKEQLEILAGLSENEQVIVDPSSAIKLLMNNANQLGATK